MEGELDCIGPPGMSVSFLDKTMLKKVQNSMSSILKS